MSTGQQASNSRKEKRIVLIAGSDQNRVCVPGERELNFDGINDSRKLLDVARVEYDVLFITPNYLKKNVRSPIDRYSLAINLISDVDQNQKVLGVVDKLLEKSPVPVINRPSVLRSTTRDQVAKALSGIGGLIVPKTLRFDRKSRKRAAEQVASGGFRFPGILRPAGTHGGEGVTLVRDVDQLTGMLSRYRESYLTEFANYRSRDGFYRKYRCFFIGDEIVFRHLIISDHWSIHARDKKRVMESTAWMVREEEAIHNKGISHFTEKQIETMKEVKSRLDVDYFGMDFSITPSGRILLFEANATMNFFPFYSDDPGHYSRKCLKPAVDAMKNLVSIAYE